MKKSGHKNGSFVLGLAGFLVVACVVMLLIALTQDKQALEARRTSPPPVYTEPRPEPVVESMVLPESEFLTRGESVDESEQLR